MVRPIAQLLTFEAYLTYNDGTDRHYELVDGELTLMNPPTIEHFLITKALEQWLDAAIARSQLPWMTFRESGVRTGFNKSRLTDVCVVTTGQAQELLGQSAVFQTPPVLIIEVVSPDSIKRDYRYKRSEYAAIAVPEYWIVDPLERQVSVLTWEEGFYEAIVLTDRESLRSPTFPDLELTVEQILAAGNLAN